MRILGYAVILLAGAAVAAIASQLRKGMLPHGSRAPFTTDSPLLELDLSVPDSVRRGVINVWVHDQKLHVEFITCANQRLIEGTVSASTNETPDWETAIGVADQQIIGQDESGYVISMPLTSLGDVETGQIIKLKFHVVVGPMVENVNPASNETETFEDVIEYEVAFGAANGPDDLPVSDVAA